ncbi:hypothetical protein M0R45_006490 [Rubus argutus]|uniref:Uncharacterized protein n=1 Tax=Rubus argutus TaxID=59490 RepID=A0AAW1YR30_RUBAR
MNRDRSTPARVRRRLGWMRAEQRAEGWQRRGITVINGSDRLELFTVAAGRLVRGREENSRAGFVAGVGVGGVAAELGSP